MNNFKLKYWNHKQMFLFNMRFPVNLFYINCILIKKYFSAIIFILINLKNGINVWKMFDISIPGVIRILNHLLMGDAH